MTVSFVIDGTKYGIQKYRTGWELMKWHVNEKSPQNSKWTNLGYYSKIQHIANELVTLGAPDEVIEDATVLVASFESAARQVAKSIEKVIDENKERAI